MRRTTHWNRTRRTLGALASVFVTLWGAALSAAISDHKASGALLWVPIFMITLCTVGAVALNSNGA